MHNPFSLNALRWPALIKDESFLDANALGAASAQNRLICTGCLPVSNPGRPIRPNAIRILPFSRAEEEPFSLTKESLACTKTKTKNKL